MNSIKFSANTILTIVFVFLSIELSYGQESNQVFERYFEHKEDIIPDTIDLSGSLRVIMEDDNYYVMDLNRGEIFVFNSNGENPFRMGGHGRGPGEFERLNSIAISESKIFAYDLALRKIATFSKEGSFLSEYRLKSKSTSPQHMFYLEGKLYLYSTDFVAEHMIQVIDAETGKVIDNFAETTFQIKEIGYPLNGLVNAFSVNSLGELFVTHFIDFTIRKFNKEGRLVSTFSAQDRLFDQPDPEGYSPPMPITRITDATINHFFANSEHIFVGYKHNEFEDLSFEILDQKGNRVYPELIKVDSKFGTPLFINDEFMVTGRFFDTSEGKKIGFAKYSLTFN
ncbi:MAG: 6-bladed beta-propeller [Balneola sp.]